MRFLSAIALALAWPVTVLAAEISPLALLTDPEVSYYEQVFSYTMDVISAGGHYNWTSYGANGSISVEAPFVSKSGATCRRFSESFTVQNHPGKDIGVGCKRGGREGWCKLKEGDALTCALETPSYRLGLPSLGSAPSGPGVSIDMPGLPSAPNSNPNVTTPGYDPGRHDKPTATGYADTVTGAAGSAAGSVAGHAGSWFNSLFR